MLFSEDWKDYELIDCANGEKLERWGDVILLRPDPQIIWDHRNLRKLYSNIDAHYHRSTSGGGAWENIKAVKPSWKIEYKNLTFCIKQMGFKHTGTSCKLGFYDGKNRKSKSTYSGLKFVCLYRWCHSCLFI